MITARKPDCNSYLMEDGIMKLAISIFVEVQLDDIFQLQRLA